VEQQRWLDAVERGCGRSSLVEAGASSGKQGDWWRRKGKEERAKRASVERADRVEKKGRVGY
jgi:hypothetical protein